MVNDVRLPDDDDQYEDQDTSYGGRPEDTEGDDGGQADYGQDYGQDAQEPQDGEQAMAQAAPHEVDAHRDMLSEAMQLLQGQGVNTSALAGQAGVDTADPNQMSHGDLISMARTLAQEHPEVLGMVAQRFPQAQGLLGSVLGGGAGGGEQGGGGILGGLLGRFLGR